MSGVDKINFWIYMAKNFILKKHHLLAYIAEILPFFFVCWKVEA